MRYDRNLFSGFAYQESLASGVGRTFLKSKANRFSAELGALTARKRLAPVDDAVLHAGAQFQHRPGENSKPLNTVRVEAGSSDTMSADDLSLQVQTRKSLALSVGVQVTNNTNPPPGKVRHTDTVTTVNLVYDFHTAKISATSPTLLQGVNLP